MALKINEFSSKRNGMTPIYIIPSSSVHVNKYSIHFSSFLLVCEDNIVTFGEKFKKNRGTFAHDYNKGVI